MHACTPTNTIHTHLNAFGGTRRKVLERHERLVILLAGFADNVNDFRVGLCHSVLVVVVVVVVGGD